jgi:hypothetical protein
MTALLLALRLAHIVSGALWVGFVILTTFYVIPSIQESGPEGGKVMAALQRRGIMTVTPILAITTLISGLGLYWWLSGGFRSEFMGSGTGITFGAGGLAAIVAYVLGMTVMRPAMLRAAALMQQAGTLPAAEREAAIAEVTRLRARGGAVGRTVAALLIFAVAAMAVGRYV